MNEPARLTGKRALVTGGGRGIGAAIARRLAAEGAAVAVNYVANASSADALVRGLADKGYQAAAFRADVADRAQTEDLVARVVAEFGGLDILASNAGVEHFGALESITDADFNRVFRQRGRPAFCHSGSGSGDENWRAHPFDVFNQRTHRRLWPHPVCGQ
jgi:3-oxoacyl-[acyl-carrier protein] reductase